MIASLCIPSGLMTGHIGSCHSHISSSGVPALPDAYHPQDASAIAYGIAGVSRGGVAVGQLPCPSLFDEV
jgi:hypothetical protein